MEGKLMRNELPEQLQEMFDCPNQLFYKGDVKLLMRNCVSVIGSRTPSAWAIEITKQIVEVLVKMNFVVVSGCAKGIDATAQRQALSSGGNSIGVLGYGSNFVYPVIEKDLIYKLSHEQLLISEYEPTTPIAKHQFIARNRIIASLSKLTIVVQSKVSSGSFITSQMALNENRELLVVPKTFDHEFAGSNLLIEEGATPLLGENQLVELLNKIYSDIIST